MQCHGTENLGGWFQRGWREREREKRWEQQGRWEAGGSQAAFGAVGHPSPPLDLNPWLASPWGLLLGCPPRPGVLPGAGWRGGWGCGAPADPTASWGGAACRQACQREGTGCQPRRAARGLAGPKGGWEPPCPDAPGWGQGRRSQDLGVASGGDSVSPQGGWRGARLPPPARREAGGGGGRWAGRRAVAEASCFCRIRLALCRTARGAEPLLAPAQSIC